MYRTIAKALRTLQSELPFLKERKDSFYLHLRRLTRTVHERDFKALKFIAPWEDNLQYLDVGANQGQSIESILLVKPQALITSFEPNPGLARKLATRHRQNQNINIVVKGLSDSVEMLTLFVPCYKGFVYDALASFDRESAAGWINERTVFGFNPAKLSIDEVTCEVTTLDLLQLAPGFIKIDAQGYEYNVLNGGRETLLRYEPVLMIEAFSSDPRTVRLAEELGYEEYYFDGKALRRGPSSSLNSFLMTPRRRKTI